MKNKNACLISKFIFENDTRLQQQVAFLEDNNFNISVICYLENEKKTIIRNNTTVYGVSRLGDKDTLLKYIWNTLKFIIPTFIKLQKLSFQNKLDIIIIHTLPELMIFIAFFQKFFGTKLILDVRDTSVELFETKWSDGKWKFLHRLVVFFANISCHFADKIIVASPGFKDKLLERKIPEEKITIIFNSADNAIFHFDKERKFEKISSGLKIIYHGSIADRFGIDIAIDAFKNIIQKIPNSTLNIYGFYDDGYKNLLKEKITKYNLEDSIFLNSRESLDNIYKLIKNSDLGIVPYKADFFMQLAFSTKLFEYVLSGIPVVTSRLKPAQFIFPEESIFFVNPNDPDDLTEKIIYLCENPNERKIRVSKAYESYSKISSDVMKEQYFKIIEQLL
ncbi:MAG: glycosyltransferase [Ignavibacteriae bacterium]|nr:glycosyltransferase [Ignavibacteriota bacterium]MCB9207946.1 glycosyltransferase [Ignavibacteriales bacterium]MCB9258715.1 glycosyltransferase [Ignavibacteriales bacterium]